VFLALVPAAMMSACGGNAKADMDEKIVTVSVLPQKYFIEQIAGDLVKVNVMIPPGASPATYEPSPSQLKDLSRSQLYFRIGYVVFEQSWMDKIRSVNPEMRIVNLSEGVDLIMEEGHQDHHHGHHHGGIDPHIWMSVPAVKIMAGKMHAALSHFLPSEKERLTRNYQDFIARLDTLDAQIRNELKHIKNRTFMIYHPSLSYFARDYGFVQYPLELEGKVPSPAHMKYLADVGKEQKVRTIFLQMQFNQQNAIALSEEIGAEIVQINPLDPEWHEQMLYITSKLKSDSHE